MTEVRPAESEPATAEAIASRYWESLLELRPYIATGIGDERYDGRLEDASPAGRRAVRDLHARTLVELDALQREARAAGGLGQDDQVTSDVLRFMCAAEIELDESDWPLLASIDQMEGPPMGLTYAAEMQRADTPERLERWLARLAAYPTLVDAHVARIEEARRRGIFPARIVAERFAGQLERRIAEPLERSPLVLGPPVAEPSDRARIADAVRDHVRPADARLLAATRAVLRESRTEPGLGSVPGGEAMYAAGRFRWTTLRTDPDELHRAGLADLDGIEAERREIARAAGFGDDTVAYRASLAADPANVPRSAEELLGRMREDMRRALDASGRWFRLRPEASCDIQPLDEALAADSLGYYLAPTPDGSRPGVFYMNTTEAPTRLFTRFATITYHETIPGHHFQLAIEAELPGLSAFRRLGARETCGAFVEGWALYTERLAGEMGLYRSEAERFGMLDAQAWRAARLVVDTGIHAFGWERDRAVSFLEDATGFDRQTAEIEVDRYIAMPAQALAYKVGQGEIERLRAEAAATAAARGTTLDLSRFHDEVLGHGSLPLDVLRARLPGWLAAG